ncbi:MAG: phosphatidylglycerol lysyltransferase domain-containing protein [Bacillota bacterium]|nr:phosphatidylglycerol lysyltransferase domain-containing protein [Bacillota bacterium]
MQCDGCTLFSIQDGPDYNRCHSLSGSELSDHCLNSRIAWNAGFYYQKMLIEDCFCLVSNGGVFTTPHVTWPLGRVTAQKLEAILDEVLPAFTSRGWPLRLMYLDEAVLPLVKALPHYTASISYNPDYSDYLYEADHLRSLSGKTMHRKRNHFNKFSRLYPQYEYHPITQDDQKEALALVQAWCDEKAVDCLNLCSSDFRAVRQLFHDMPSLDVRGGSIRIDGRLVAFALGSLLNGDTAVIHFEKAEAIYDGLYAAINKLVLDHAFPEARWVNREEDMGIAGLRKAKESYGPIRLIHKYEALLHRM